MKQIKIIGFISIAVMFASSVVPILLISKINQAEKEIKSYVGTKVEVAGDTLTILDYSLLEENYTLSNGVKVSYEFIKQSNKIR